MTGSPTGGTRWIVDPIDGTVNYLYGLPGWAVSVAAERGGSVEIGVVVVPTLGETFTAIRGEGAWLGTRRLAVSTCSTLEQALVATGFSYRRDVRQEQGAVVASLLTHVRDIRRLGAASVDLCALAAARVDAFFERGLQPWDRAAGVLIAREAGAHVREDAGGGVVAAGPNLIDTFAKALEVA